MDSQSDMIPRWVSKDATDWLSVIHAVVVHVSVLFTSYSSLIQDTKFRLTPFNSTVIVVLKYDCRYLMQYNIKE